MEHLNHLTIGEAVAHFFGKKKTIFYYPGLCMRTEGTYEEDFLRIASQMENKGMILNKTGLALAPTLLSRNELFDDFRVADVYSMKIDGLLFIPELSRWSPIMGEMNLVNIANHYLARAEEEKGVLLYNLESDPTLFRLKKQEQEKAIESFERSIGVDYALLRIESRAYGTSFAIKKN